MAPEARESALSFSFVVGPTQSGRMRGLWLGFEVAVIAAGAIAKFVSWGLSRPASALGDAHSYLPGPTLAIQPDPSTGLEKVSFIGEAIRPWPPVLLYGVLPTMDSRALAQVGISAVAFAMLAVSAAASFRDRRVRLAAVALVTIVGCSPQVLTWDMAMGRESLTISFSALFLASVLAVARKVTTWRIIALMLLGLLVTIMRLNGFLFVAAMTLAAVVLGSARISSGFWSVKRSAGIAAVCLVGIGTYGTVLTERHDAAWKSWYGQTSTASQFGYMLSEWSGGGDQLVAALEPELPPCALAALPVKTEPISKPWYFILDLQASCPEFTAWVEDGRWRAWFLKYAVTHPSYIAAVFADALPLNISPGSASTVVPAVPVSFSSVVFTSYTDQQVRFEPLVVWGLLLALLLVGCVRVHGWSRSLKRLTALGLAFSAGAGLWVLTNEIFAPIHWVDSWRISIGAGVLVRLAVPLAALWLVDQWITSRRASVQSRSDQTSMSPAP